MKGLVLSVGLLAAVFAFVHPTRILRDWGEHLDPFRTSVVFAQQADAICADYGRTMSDLPQAAIASMAEVQSVATRLFVASQQEVAKLHALPLPTKNRALAQAWIAANDQLVVLLRQLRDAVQRNDMAALLMVFADLDANVERADEFAVRLGMHHCSSM